MLNIFIEKIQFKPYVYLNERTAHTVRLEIQLGIPTESTRHCKIWYDGTIAYSQLNGGDVVETSNLLQMDNLEILELVSKF